MLDILIGCIIGLIQGVTEILPISSTAHLILAGRLFGLADRGLEFDVLMNFASWLAIIAFFYRTLFMILKSWYKYINKTKYGNLSSQEQTYSLLGLYLLLSTIPAVVAGFMWEDMIETYLRSNLTIGISLIMGGIFLWLSDRFTLGKKASTDLPWWRILIIGLFQSLALIPGMSRSGSSITGARLMGLSREESASFAFLMGTPIIIAATASQIPQLLQNTSVLGWDFAAGFFGAILGTYLTITLFLNFIKKQTYTIFVVYRVLIGGLLILLTIYE
jgi:undecaprenyl-diphosphatase